MGCDIHAVLEVKKDGVWENINDIDIEKYLDKPDYYNAVDVFTPRNYAAFGNIAGVRYPEAPGGLIAGIRGCPSDMAPISKKCMEPDDPDLHSWTWLTLQDFLSFDMNQQAPQEMVVGVETWVNHTLRWHTPTWKEEINNPKDVYSYEQMEQAWEKLKEAFPDIKDQRKDQVLGLNSASNAALGIPHHLEDDFVNILPGNRINKFEDIAVKWVWYVNPKEHFSEYYCYYVSRLAQEAAKHSVSYDKVRVIFAFDN